MGVLVKGPWSAPSLVKLVHERKRLDRLIEDTCTERIAALDREERAHAFQAPSAHIGRWRDAQVVDVLLNLAPRPDRVPRNQLPERLD